MSQPKLFHQNQPLRVFHEVPKNYYATFELMWLVNGEQKLLVQKWKDQKRGTVCWVLVPTLEAEKNESPKSIE